MKILIINGSPRGRFSVTLQSCLYLEKRFTEHEFEFLNVGAGINAFERDMSGAFEAIASAELIIFSYPVYTMLVPSQLHRFIELLKAGGVDLSGLYATQLSTSKHFYDFTAHRFIEDNCRDMGMKVIHGLSADMEDLLSPQGRKELEDFFKYAVFCVENGLHEPVPPQAEGKAAEYTCALEQGKKADGFDTVIVADLRDGDEGLRAMIKDFGAAFPYKTRFVNLADFKFKGGCLGCLNCASSGKCVYDDGFETFLRENILNADAIVYAFTVRDHSMGSRFKTFDDRQFCNGHRTLSEGKSVGYIVNGDLSREENLRAVIEARAETGHCFLAGCACDLEGMKILAKRLAYGLEHKYLPPRSFYGVGGMKIFRDLIWQMRGLMKADHDFYKSKGMYDFPQKKWPRMIGMSILGFLMRRPKLRPVFAAKMNVGMLEPYKKVLRELEK